jgi:hypothetical protein
MAAANRPRIDYDVTTLLLDLPMMRWRPGTSGLGGTLTTATGIPVAYLIRRDELLAVVLRFRESEWPGVRAWLHWAMSHPNESEFFPDQDIPGTSFDVWLEYPRLEPGGSLVQPERAADSPCIFELPILLRETSGAVFNLPFYV